MRGQGSMAGSTVAEATEARMLDSTQDAASSIHMALLKPPRT